MTYLLIGLIGLAGGILSGLFGIGGGLVIVPDYAGGATSHTSKAAVAVALASRMARITGAVQPSSPARNRR